MGRLVIDVPPCFGSRPARTIEGRRRTMQVTIDVPSPASGMDPAGEMHAATWLRDRVEGLRRDYLELFLPDAPVE